MPGSTHDIALPREAGLLGPPAGQLALRVVSGRDAGSLIVISAPKCAIGTARECDLRLRGPGFDPYHCLVLRGCDKTIIRRRSPRTRLNGRLFEDAPLQLGDRVRLGTLELEVIAGDAPAPSGVDVAERLTTQLAEVQRQLSHLEHDYSQLQQHAGTQQEVWERERTQAAEYWERVEQAARATITHLEGELAELRRRSGELEQRLAAREAAHAASLEQVRQHAAETQQLRDRVAQLHEQLGQRDQIADAMRYELEGLRHAQEQCEQSLVKQALLEQQVASLRLQLEQQQANAEAAEADWQRQHAEWQRQLSQLREEIAHAPSVFAPREDGAALGEAPAEPRGESPVAWAESQSDLNAHPKRSCEVQAVDEPEFATVDGYGGEAESSPEDRFGREEARPTSVADVLERLKAAGHWHDEEGEGDSDISSLGPASMPAPAGCRSEGSAESAGAEDDASIQKYLDGLLHRVRGQQDVPPPLGLEEVTPHVQCEVGIPAARRVAEPAPYVRREVAPEARVGLDAMRKVANESARSAIETHARKVAVEQIRSSWAFAALSVFGVFWGTAAWSVLAKSSPLLGRVGAGIGYGMAGVFTLLAVVHRFRGRKPEPESEPPLADEPSR